MKRLVLLIALMLTTIAVKAQYPVVYIHGTPVNFGDTVSIPKGNPILFVFANPAYTMEWVKGGIHTTFGMGLNIGLPSFGWYRVNVFNKGVKFYSVRVYTKKQ